MADTTLSEEALRYKIESNIPYRAECGSASKDKEYERCVLDLLFPENRKGFNTVLWFHGGGLTGGEKYIPEGLKQSGLAVAAANYRLSPMVKCAECLEDAAAAAAWVFSKIESFGGNTGKIFIAGHSAGAYLANMLTLDKTWLKKYGIDANKFAGSIPLSGHTITHFSVRAESGIPALKPSIDSLAPLYHVRGDAPPMLLITGDREKELFGRYEENAYFLRMLRLNGHQDSTLYELQGYGHDMVEPAIRPMKEFLTRISPFC
ncbi:MAG: lipase [Lentisphaerae bacterium GWF2_52_8]|nr:MAG: lipase [Lentisphaerae bacterium GWF2_52_8]